MTASTVKSSEITNLTALPRVDENAGEAGGKVRLFAGTLEVATTSVDEIGDIIRMIRLPHARFRPISLKGFSDDLDSDSALRVNVGLYKVNFDDSVTVMDADCFASAVDATPFSGSTTGGLELLNEAADIDQRGLEIWDYAVGQAADPGVPVEVCVTVSTAGTSADAGTLRLELLAVEY